MKEAREKRSTDQNSVYAIVIAGLLSQVVAVLEWGYLHPVFGVVENKLVTAIGFALLVAGIAFRIWSIHTLGKFFTSTVQVQTGQRVITSGPYSVLRHPSYSGAFTAILGGTIFLQAPIAAFVAIVGMSYAYKLRIAAEEETMVKEFGEEYRLYQQHSYRLIPLVW
jgi:protein-S-isoprenylcysteine O-methyltransferase